MVKALGSSTVPFAFTGFLTEPPTWRRASKQLIVRVNAELNTSEYGQSIRSIRSAEPLQPDHSVRFCAKSSIGASVVRVGSLKAKRA